jgi:hypothetical protein
MKTKLTHAEILIRVTYQQFRILVILRIASIKHMILLLKNPENYNDFKIEWILLDLHELAAHLFQPNIYQQFRIISINGTNAERTEAPPKIKARKHG